MDEKKSLSLCLREDLVSDRVTLRQLAADLNSCILTPTNDIAAEDARAAYDFVIANKSRVPKNSEGVRVLEKGDAIRSEVCRILFHIPLSNLMRRETRTLDTSPEDSAIPEVVQDIPPATPDKKAKTHAKGKTVKRSNIPVHTVEEYDSPDPHAYEGYIGNKGIVSTIEKQIDGALMRGDPLRPLLLRGASGCGKTELARRTARKIGKRLFRVTASVLKTSDDVYELLGAMSEGDALLVDEAQAMSPKASAVFFDVTSNGYKAEDGTVKEFFFIFATNISAKLPDALKNRCLELRLNDYSVSELAQMVQATAQNAEMGLENGVAEYIAERSHGIARYAIDYTKDVITENAGKGQSITLEQVQSFFALRGIDSLGLKVEHRNYVHQLSLLGQASVATLAAALGENDTSEIEKATEPFLLKHGLITITSNGRTLTEAGKTYAKLA